MPPIFLKRPFRIVARVLLTLALAGVVLWTSLVLAFCLPGPPSL